jgi:hypothetical protein
MKRAHRRAHAVLWLLIIPAIAALLVLARRAPSPPPGDPTLSEPAP